MNFKKPLDRDASNALLDALAIAAKTDPKAENELVRRLNELVFFIIRRHVKRARDKHIVPDLAQQGRIGIHTAIDRFDPNRGTFFVCAYTWIRYEVCLYADRYLEIVRRRLHGKNAERPWPKSISIDSGDTVHQNDMGEDRSWQDLLADDRDEEEELSDADRAAACHQLAPALLGLLDEREAVVLCHRIANGATLDQVGEDLGISRERARQIQEQALTRLHEKLLGDKKRPDNFDAFLVQVQKRLGRRPIAEPKRWNT